MKNEDSIKLENSDSFLSDVYWVSTVLFIQIIIQ